jgi:hypothetical protein
LSRFGAAKNYTSGQLLLRRGQLNRPATSSATSSVLTSIGHKEDVVVKSVAEALCARLGAHVVVTAGLHWDDLQERGVVAIRASCTELVDLVALALTRDPPAG